MSKPVASESTDGHETLNPIRKSGREDEEKEDEEIIEGTAALNLTTSTTVSAATAATDQFMHTPEFKRHLVEFVPVDALMALRLATKGWNAAADALIDEVGNRACQYANLVVVDIPEGVVSIGECAFWMCTSLTTVSFPTTLKSIGEAAFFECHRLENFHLLHTNLQELGENAFSECSELKSVKIPDPLQTLGPDVFYYCSKLVPSYIDVSNDENDVTSEVIAYLRAKNLPANEFVDSKYFQTNLLLPYVTSNMMMAMRLVSKGWNDATNTFVDREVNNGEMIVHDGNDVGVGIDSEDIQSWQYEINEMNEPVKRVVFLLNITKLGDYACLYAVNLVVVDIPEGVQSIGPFMQLLKSSPTSAEMFDAPTF